MTLVCSKCRTAMPESRTVCDCGASLIAPEYMARGPRRPEGQKEEVLKPRLPPKRGPNWGMMGVLVFAFMAIFVLPSLVRQSATKKTASDALRETALAVAAAEQNGTLDQTSMSRFTENGRRASGCGHVHIYIVPAPAPSAPSSGIGIGAGAPPDPLEQVHQFVQKEFRPDAESEVLADEGQTVVIVLGWSC